MRDNTIVVIAGDSGSGKTTIARMLHEYYSVPLLTFSSLGKELSVMKGYSRLRDFFLNSPQEIFCSELNDYLTKRILSFSEYNSCFIIEGLISSQVIRNLKNEFNNINVVTIQVDESLRIKRIAARLSCSMKDAMNENMLKAKIKKILGIDEIIALSNYIVDGNRNASEVFNEFLQYHFFVQAVAV